MLIRAYILNIQYFVEHQYFAFSETFGVFVFNYCVNICVINCLSGKTIILYSKR